MSTPRFPRSPDIHNRPFQDGSNPFRDEQPAPTPTGAANDNLYGSSASDQRPAKTSQDYEAFLPNRSRVVLVIGIIGAALAGLSSLLAVGAMASMNLLEGLYFILPISLTSVALTIPAWTMAHGDLAAIRAGAMDDRGRGATRLAFWCGCLGTILGLLPAGGGIVSLVLIIIS